MTDISGNLLWDGEYTA
ncbi:hypothetical protein [Streptococcus oralis]|nr:hypothetical protein [Streptococcus oralis]